MAVGQLHYMGINAAAQMRGLSALLS
jgi:hypothetical protein